MALPTKRLVIFSHKERHALSRYCFQQRVETAVDRDLDEHASLLLANGWNAFPNMLPTEADCAAALCKATSLKRAWRVCHCFMALSKGYN